MVLSVEEYNVEKLYIAADEYANVIPTIARHFIHEANTIKEKCSIQETPLHLNCQYCSTVFKPDNQRIKVIPRMKLNRKIKRLLQRSNTNNLGVFQQKMVQMYLNSHNRLKITCKTCGKTTVIFCQSRQSRLAQKAAAMEIEPKKLSKSAKKRLKMKKKSKEEDSGLDLSYISTRSVFGNVSKNLVKTPSHVGTKPVFTSTPKDSTSCKFAETKKVGISFSLSNASSSSQQNDTSFNSLSKKNSKKQRQKNKHELLHKMLAKEKDKNKQNNSGSLKDFLSSL